MCAEKAIEKESAWGGYRICKGVPVVERESVCVCVAENFKDDV